MSSLQSTLNHPATVLTTTDVEWQKVGEDWSLPSWNGLINDAKSPVKPGRPAFYYKPSDKAEVLAACRKAQQLGLKVSPRGSGHHYGGVSFVEGGLLLDLSDLRHVDVDPAGRTARVGPAATARQLRAAIGPVGLHFPVPHLSDVGVSGYILGGGNGWGVRQWGAAADQVSELEVVLLDGAMAPDSAGGTGSGAEGQAPHPSGGGCRLVRVNAETDPELFWGLRGGGSFLGVVTEFVVRLHPVPPRLPLISATFPLIHLDKLLEFFREYHRANPPFLEASLAVVGAPEGTAPGGGAEGREASREGGLGETGASSNRSWRAAPDPTEVASSDSYCGSHSVACDGREPAGANGASGCGATGVPAVVVVSCTAFAEPGSPEVEKSYARLRALLPEARLSLQEGPLLYDEALSILDPGWRFPDLRMYGHGAFLPVQSLRQGSGGAAEALVVAAGTMTSRRSILLVCPSAPSTPGFEAAAGAAAGDGSGDTGVGGGSGGATACSACTKGALGFRDTFYIGIYSMWTRSEAGPAADGDAAHVGWVRCLASSLEPHLEGLYVNEVMHDDPGQVRRSYQSADYERLRELKRRVDPQGLLRQL